jgi:branched-chain amino acid transport system ATP-binding protein
VTAPVAAKPILDIKNIEVIYDHVILVLKGVSLTVPKGGIVAILGANGAGKSTTLKSISNLVKSERGEVTKGSIEFNGERVDELMPDDLVKRGCIQVMEGRHCFGHLTIEENLRTGAFTRPGGRTAEAEGLEMVYTYFPRLKERRNSLAGYTSGGEQQMCAIGRGLMARPTLLLIDELSLGLAPVMVDRLVEGVRAIHRAGTTLLLVEQDVATALDMARRAYVIANGRIVLQGESRVVLESDLVREAYLGI